MDNIKQDRKNVCLKNKRVDILLEAGSPKSFVLADWHAQG